MTRSSSKMTKPPSAVLMVKSRLIMPTIAPSRRNTKTRPRLGCSKIKRKPRSCFSLSGRKSLSWANNSPSIADNSSKSASVAGSITTFSLIVCTAYFKKRRRWQSPNEDRQSRRAAQLTMLLPFLVQPLPNWAESYFRFYETDLPAIEANPETPARFSCPHEDKRRPGDTCPPAATRSQTFAPKRRRKALRPPYASLASRFQRAISPEDLGVGVGFSTSRFPLREIELTSRKNSERTYGSLNNKHRT